MKRIFSALIVAVLGAQMLAALPIAHAATTIPETVQITDPANDANTTSGDTVGPANVSNVGDILKVWFTSDATTVTANMQVAVAPPATADGIAFTVYTNPSDSFPSPQGCLRFVTIIPGSAPGGGTWQAKTLVKLVDRCNDKGTSFFANGVEGTGTVDTLEDGSGVVSMTFPRSYSPLLADGGSILQPAGRTDAYAGEDSAPSPVGSNASGFRLDDTKVGTDYALTSGSQTPPTAPKPPVKHKKHKKKPPVPAPAGCPAYQPGDAGKDAKTTVVTDAATKDAPISVQLPLAQGAGTGTGISQVDAVTLATESHAFQNVQVDSNSSSVGLYVRAEFDTQSDDDLHLLNSDGTEAAHAAGFNVAPESLPVAPFGQPLDGTGSGGHSESGAEQIDGIKTADCQGYTAELDGATTRGGTITLKFWLGAVAYDPSAASAGAAKPI
ncbi:MAG: hypothetical protein QOF16_425 [Actinomycetota bacterium]|nr:hypothetical protein [Actinomycetota bacterium]